MKKRSMMNSIEVTEGWKRVRELRRMAPPGWMRRSFGSLVATRMMARRPAR